MEEAISENPLDLCNVAVRRARWRAGDEGDDGDAISRYR